MAELILQLADPVTSAEGVAYVVQVWAESNHRWQAWLVFIAADGRILRTERETTGPRRDAIRAWADRLRAPDLEQALRRAVAPSAHLPAA